jgi:hypothetical protein
LIATNKIKCIELDSGLKKRLVHGEHKVDGKHTKYIYDFKGLNPKNARVRLMENIESGKLSVTIDFMEAGEYKKSVWLNPYAPAKGKKKVSGGYYYQTWEKVTPKYNSKTPKGIHAAFHSKVDVENDNFPDFDEISKWVEEFKGDIDLVFKKNSYAVTPWGNFNYNTSIKIPYIGIALSKLGEQKMDCEFVLKLGLSVIKGKFEPNNDSFGNSNVSKCKCVGIYHYSTSENQDLSIFQANKLK